MERAGTAAALLRLWHGNAMASTFKFCALLWHYSHGTAVTHGSAMAVTLAVPPGSEPGQCISAVPWQWLFHDTTMALPRQCHGNGGALPHPPIIYGDWIRPLI